MNLSSTIRKSSKFPNFEHEESIFLVKGDGEVAHIVFLLSALHLGVAFIPVNKAWDRSPTLGLPMSTKWIECKGSTISFENHEWSLLDPYFALDTENAINEISFNDGPNNWDRQESLACCFPTSGTTGQPKMIAVTNHQLAKGAVFVSSALDLHRSDVITGMLSLDFDYGLNQVFTTIAIGGTYVCCQLSMASNESLERLQNAQPTVIATMPFLVDTYFSGLKSGSFPTVRLVTSSGGPLIDRHRKEIHRVCPSAKIIPMYGLSEGFRATISTGEIDQMHPDSVGIPIGDTEISIRDPEGRPLPPYGVGEIWQSGGCISWGYWNDPISTRARFVDDSEFPNKRWLKSGDLGFLNKEGYLFVVGRLSFQIKKFGHRVSIDEVESHISEVVGGLVCVAVPIQISNTESDFDAFIEAPAAELTHLIEKIRTTLSSELWPRRLFCIDKVPLNVYGGKPDRQSLIALSKNPSSFNSAKVNPRHES